MHLPGSGAMEFLPFWGYLVFLVYCMRRVNCQQCGVLVEEVPWGVGNTPRPRSTCISWGIGRANSPGRKRPKNFASWDKVHDAVAYLVGGGWSIGSWGRFAPLGWMRFICQRGEISDLGVSDRPGLHPAAVDRQGTDRENLPGILCHDWPGGIGEDRVCLLGHVEALSGCDSPSSRGKTRRPPSPPSTAPVSKRRWTPSFWPRSRRPA